MHYCTGYDSYLCLIAGQLRPIAGWLHIINYCLLSGYAWEQTKSLNFPTSGQTSHRWVFHQNTTNAISKFSNACELFCNGICEKHVNSSNTPKFIKDKTSKIVFLKEIWAEISKYTSKWQRQNVRIKPCRRKIDHKSKFSFASTQFFQAYKRVFPISCLEHKKHKCKDGQALALALVEPWQLIEATRLLVGKSWNRSIAVPRLMVNHSSEMILSNI